MFRSVIAEAIASKSIGSENVKSAGTYVGAPEEPEGQPVSELKHLKQYINFMTDRGYDIANRKTLRVTSEMVGWADVIIDMSEKECDLDILKESEKTIYWDVENPIFQNYSDPDAYQKTAEIYDILAKDVETLLQTLKLQETQ